MMLAAIAALVGCDALSAMEYFDHATGDTHVDFGADQFMGNRVAVVRRLDVIIDIDDRKAPFGKLIIAFRQGRSAGFSTLVIRSSRLSLRRRLT